MVVRHVMELNVQNVVPKIPQTLMKTSTAILSINAIAVDINGQIDPKELVNFHS